MKSEMARPFLIEFGAEEFTTDLILSGFIGLIEHMDIRRPRRSLSLAQETERPFEI
jgi:hypothetical protein